MVKKEEIECLAHAIWERERCPEGKADEHWHRARQFLENQEVADAANTPNLASIANQLADIQRTEQTATKISQFRFRFSFAVAMMAIAVTIGFLSPPIIISGVNSLAIGTVLALLSFTLIFVSEVDLEPGRFHPSRIRWALWVMLGGIALLLVVPITNYHRPDTFASYLQFAGLVIFTVGVYATIFSMKRTSQEDTM